ncbi:MAG: hypothetical protein PVI28_17785 [Gammaproteobacteria bacterium]
MTRTHSTESSKPIETRGPWPFITYRTYRSGDGSRVVWHSRVHRKRLPAEPATKALRLGRVSLRSLWMPRQLNWWIAMIFALGASLFILGGVLSLAPGLAQAWSLDSRAVNMIFFAGSIPFTTAAYLQLFQSANAGEFSPLGVTEKPRTVAFGWRPHDIGWLSCALQFPGTLLFNINTFDALLPELDWLQQDLAIWAPDVAGSLLFLASGHLAFAETSHAHFAWRPQSLSWWVTFVNLLGCVAFMISAVFAFVPPQAPGFDAAGLASLFTLIGAGGFLIGSLLMLPETALPGPAQPAENPA